MYTLVCHIFKLVYWGINPRNKWKEKPGQPVSQAYDSIKFSLRFVEWLSIAIQLFKGTCKACKRMILNLPRFSEWFQVIGFPETPIAGQGMTGQAMDWINQSNLNPLGRFKVWFTTISMPLDIRKSRDIEMESWSWCIAVNCSIHQFIWEFVVYICFLMIFYVYIYINTYVRIIIYTCILYKLSDTYIHT